MSQAQDLWYILQIFDEDNSQISQELWELDGINLDYEVNT